MPFRSPFLHPSSLLLACLVALTSIQFAGLAGLLAALVVLGAVARPPALAWWRLLVRMRWLLASAWLIIAYGVPGDAWLDLSWLPTEQGLQEASLQAGRLVFTLGCLAWLFARLPAEKLMVALVGLVPQAQRAGSTGERLAVRLWLVMALLQDRGQQPGWREMLHPLAVPAGLPDSLRLVLPQWRAADAALALGVGAAGVTLILFG
jgi:energy-coupling factor transporter transmembrane protein EcfT